jgi:hypothetical protein
MGKSRRYMGSKGLGDGITGIRIKMIGDRMGKRWCYMDSKGIGIKG